MQRDVFHWTIRTYFEDTDSGGLVYHTSYLRFMERARTEWLRALGFSQERLLGELGVLFVVRSVTIKYIRPAMLDDELAVTTRTRRHRRAGLHFDQRIRRLNADGADLCRGAIEVVCMSAPTRRPRAIPSSIAVEITHGG